MKHAKKKAANDGKEPDECTAALAKVSLTETSEHLKKFVSSYIKINKVEECGSVEAE